VTVNTLSVNVTARALDVFNAPWVDELVYMCVLRPSLSLSLSRTHARTHIHAHKHTHTHTLIHTHTQKVYPAQLLLKLAGLQKMSYESVFEAQADASAGCWYAHTHTHPPLHAHTYALMHACMQHIHTYSYIDRKTPPPPGGFCIYYVPSSRAVCKRTPLKAPGTNPSRGVLLHTALQEGT